MKKILTSLLAVILIATLCAIPAFAADGIDTTAELKAALEGANDGDVIAITGDFTLTEGLKIEKKVTIEGNGFTITSDASVRKTFQIFSDAEFKNITIKNKYTGDARVLDTRAGGIKLTLTKATIETVAGINSQPLTIGGNANTADNFVTVNVKDSSIKAAPSGYAIIIFNPVKMTIDNSKLEGYTTIYAREASSSVGSKGSVIDVINGSELYGFNPYSGESNAFATITISDDNVTVNVDKTSTVKANSTGDQPQSILLFKGYKDSNITINGKVEITSVSAEKYLVNGVKAEDNNTIVFPVEFAEQLKQEGINVTTLNGVATSICKDGTHSLEKVAAKAATEEADGLKEHYACKNCVALFEDETGSKMINDADSLVIPKLEKKNPANGDNLFGLYAAVVTLTLSVAALFISKRKVQD